MNAHPAGTEAAAPVLGSVAYPDALRELEARLIDARRDAAKVESDQPEVGLALSGGGIRSATFGLGVLQFLAKEDLLKRVDYLSTVSGGGYIGGFLGTLYGRGDGLDAFSACGGTTTEKVRGILTDRTSKPLRWLREHGRYLAPNGSGDVLAGLAVAVRNFVSVHVVMALLFLPVAIGFVALVHPDAVPGPVPKTWMCALLVIAAACALPGAGYWCLLFLGGANNARLNRPRRWLSAGLGYLLLVLFAVAVLGILETAAAFALEKILALEKESWKGYGLGAAVAFVFATGPVLVQKMRNAAGKVAGLGLAYACGVVGTVLFLLYLFLHLLAAEALLHPEVTNDIVVICVVGICVASLLALALAVAKPFRMRLSFLSESSFAPLYQARLARAYLGASNPKRHQAKKSVLEPVEGDDFQLSTYRPHEQGGPIHLINATINETISGKSQIEHRDRKGIGICVGPVAASVGVRHHAKWGMEKGAAVLDPLSKDASGFQVFTQPEGKWIHYEPMSLARWIAISGAAVATGMGASNGMGTGLLFGIFNMRLGHWWNSGVPSSYRPKEPGKLLSAKFEGLMSQLLPLHSFFLYEWFGRFYGTAQKHWYLSDGGHYENTGVYELLRRSLPLIVVSDCGCDATFKYEDLGNLVRKARIDFGAEITFLHDPEVRVAFPDTPSLGSFDQIGRACRGANSQAVPCTAHALAAMIDYENGRSGLMIVLKPSLSGDEAADIAEYARTHDAYPHESTGDQFFGEAQWESYRALGYHVAKAVLGNGNLHGVLNRICAQEGCRQVEPLTGR